MEGKIYLKGITWNHPRGYQSIRAVSEAYQQLHPNTNITWDVRSLKDFGDYPVTQLAQTYDFIMMDHPHIGSAVEANALLPLDQWLDAEYLNDQNANSVGRSYESYHDRGCQWALAVDAAAQVSAYRPDLMEKKHVGIPRHWDEVISLAKKFQGKSAVALPLCETDVYCSFLSICANKKGMDVFNREEGVDREAAIYALSILRELIEYVHPESLEMNPVQMLDRMAETDEIAYIPLIFGYSNYGRPSKLGHHIVRFTNIPSVTSIPEGALLGGVGLSISSKCKEKKLAADFVRFAADGGTQKEIYYANEGQPGYLGVWMDQEVNATCNQFFADTLETLKHSYLRPRYEGYNAFQEEAGILLHAGLKNRNRPEDMVEKLRELFGHLKKEGGIV